MDYAKKTFLNANTLVAEVATTGPMSGDAGYGGKTYLKLTDDAGTGWWIEFTDEDGKVGSIHMPKSIMITVQGDAELATFSDSLECLTD